jgi:hypothetical protein
MRTLIDILLYPSYDSLPLLDFSSKGDANVRPSSHSLRFDVYVVRHRLYPKAKTSTRTDAQTDRPIVVNVLVR